MLKNNANARKSLVFIIAFLLMSCVSTSLDNNLDTTLEGKGNNLVFSWSEQHPFAQTYKTARIQLVAEYVEQDPNGRTRNVKQVLSQPARNFSEINTKVFTLPPKLRSIPASSNVCLYLSMNNQPIPVRASVAGSESSRFAFPFWQKNVYSQTKSEYYSRILARAKANLAKAVNAEQQALKAPFSRLNEFNSVLKKENNKGLSSISRIEQCDDIVIEPQFAKKTLDILSEEQILPTANAICTAASFDLIDQFIPLYSKAKTDSAKEFYRKRMADFSTALILPAIYRFKNQLQQAGFFASAQYMSIKPIYERFEKLAEFADQYKQQANVFKPSGIKIFTSPYTFEAGKLTIFDSLLGIPNKNYTGAQLREVVYNESSEITYCTHDFIKHLNTKRQSFALNIENAPKRAIAANTYFKNYCKSVFNNKVDTASKYTNQRIQAEKTLAQLQAEYDESELQNENNRAATDQQLNQLACKI
ncbi:hypothetical protein [Glaciecola petra]|uniref:Lipoprotein n=1 Tax=Glaciecola petra TaxID=3075602 RepID=A0ABU2ZU54_9ALTE|nr:hypothetical protein [Aestuariibacter sp. P117]MDT0594952.1 hypothetical protein [Aestuariibacter sp. P117]